MPELPEVQTLVDDLKALGTIGQRIEAVKVLCPSLLAGTGPDEFCRHLRGQVIKGIRRRGKYIVWTMGKDWHLVVHLRMSGHFFFAGTGKPRARHVHILFQLSDGRWLAYQDTRKFGRFYLVADPGIVVGKLGPEPFDKRLTASRLGRMLAKRRRRIKPLLLDQTFIAGLGNIYTDEALWEASIHPLTLACNLAADDVARLLRAIRKVLRQGIRNRGTSLGKGLNNFSNLERRAGDNAGGLKVYRRSGRPCHRCGTVIERMVVAQRSTHVCPACQQEPGHCQNVDYSTM